MPKDHWRVEAYGAVDELNAQLGLAAVAATDDLLPRLREVQNQLFQLGADLATPAGTRASAHLQRVGEADIGRLERWIDEAEATLRPLAEFILPGGSELAARLHLARTVCRRAERRLVSLTDQQEINPQALVYLNRLSDLLFVWARRANHGQGLRDIPWRKP